MKICISIGAAEDDSLATVAHPELSIGFNGFLLFCQMIIILINLFSKFKYYSSIYFFVLFLLTLVWRYIFTLYLFYHLTFLRCIDLLWYCNSCNHIAFFKPLRTEVPKISPCWRQERNIVRKLRDISFYIRVYIDIILSMNEIIRE